MRTNNTEGHQTDQHTNLKHELNIEKSNVEVSKWESRTELGRMRGTSLK